MTTLWAAPEEGRRSNFGFRQQALARDLVTHTTPRKYLSGWGVSDFTV